jgi:hypothetical protein
MNGISAALSVRALPEPRCVVLRHGNSVRAGRQRGTE